MILLCFILLIVIPAFCTIWNFIEVRRTRKLYRQLKSEQQIFRQRQAQWALDMLYAFHDPEMTKEEVLLTLEELYHELNGDAILKQMKK